MVKRVALLLFLAAPAFANIALVGSVLINAVHSATISQAITVSAGNTITVACTVQGGVAITNVTDGTNTYVQDVTFGASEILSFFHTTNTITAGTYTPACNLASSYYGAIMVAQYSGFAASAFDASNGLASYGTSPYSGGSITVNGDTWNSTWTMTGGIGQWAVGIVSYKGVAGKDLVISVLSSSYNGTGSALVAPTGTTLRASYLNGGAIIIAGYSDNSPPANLNPALSFSGCPSTGNLNAASTTCTVNLSVVSFDGAHSVTLSDSGALGTFTPSIGSPCLSTCTITPPSGTSFTFTYTPISVGVQNFILTNPSGWTDPANSVYTVSSTDSCTMTATANGNYNAAGTWNASACSGGGHTTPMSGDKIILTGFHVTCQTGLCMAGTAPANNTTYDLTISQSGSTSGWLEVASGATFYLTGNFKLNSSAGASPISFSILQVDTGGTFIHHNNNSASVSYRGVPGASNNWNQLIFGTLGDTCTFAAIPSCSTSYTGVGTGGGLNPIMFAMNSLTDAVTYQVYGASVANCGTATIPCKEVGSAGTTNGYANAGIIDLEGSAYNNTWAISDGSTNGYSTISKIAFKNNRSTNDLIGWWSLPSGNSGSTGTPASCIITGNFFSSAFSFPASHAAAAWSGCFFTWNVFSHGFGASQAASAPYGSFAHNFQITGPTTTTQPGGDQDLVYNYLFNYLYYETLGVSVSNHSGPNGYTFSPLIQGNIGESDQASPVEGHLFADALATSAYTATVLDNLALISPSGAPAGSWSGYALTCPSFSAQTVHQDHNGVNGLAVQGWQTFIGHPTSCYPTNAVYLSMRANIGYSPTTGTNNFMLYDLQQAYGGTSVLVTNGTWTTASNIITVVSASGLRNGQIAQATGIANGTTIIGISGLNITLSQAPAINETAQSIQFWTTPTTLLNSNNLVSYNNTFNPTASTLFNGSTSPNAACLPSPFNGSSYQFCQPTAGSWAATGETHANPKYIGGSSPGGARTFVATQGFAATNAGIRSYFSSCQNLVNCIGLLETSVWRNHQPTNLALKGTAPDGRIIGVTGTYGSGYTGPCGITFTPQDVDDLGSGATGTCTFAGGIVSNVQITNPGAQTGNGHYRIATPATATITCGGCTPGVAASLKAVVQAGDIGPVYMSVLPGAMTL